MINKVQIMQPQSIATCIFSTFLPAENHILNFYQSFFYRSLSAGDLYRIFLLLFVFGRDCDFWQLHFHFCLVSCVTAFFLFEMYSTEQSNSEFFISMLNEFPKACWIGIHITVTSLSKTSQPTSLHRGTILQQDLCSNVLLSHLTVSTCQQESRLPCGPTQPGCFLGSQIESVT